MEKVSPDQASINTNTDVVADPNVKVVQLENPILRGTQEVIEITIRKPNVGSLRGLSLQNVLQWDVESMAKLLPRITSPA
ncbi:MAG: phage tail assembly protein, partial [Moraxellaceae bacterium]